MCIPCDPDSAIPINAVNASGAQIDPAVLKSGSVSVSTFEERLHGSPIVAEPVEQTGPGVEQQVRRHQGCGVVDRVLRGSSTVDSLEEQRTELEQIVGLLDPYRVLDARACAAAGLTYHTLGMPPLAPAA